MQSIFSNALSRAIAKHIGDKTRDVVVAGAAAYAARNDQPVAAGSACGKHGAYRLGAATILSVLSVRLARQHTGCTCGS